MKSKVWIELHVLTDWDHGLLPYRLFLKHLKILFFSKIQILISDISLDIRNFGKRTTPFDLGAQKLYYSIPNSKFKKFVNAPPQNPPRIQTQTL